MACIVDAAPGFRLLIGVTSYPMIHRPLPQHIQEYIPAQHAHLTQARAPNTPQNRNEGLDRCGVMLLLPIGLLNAGIGPTPHSTVHLQELE